jgi:holo-[acyl-carrier protein] synthase
MIVGIGIDIVNIQRFRDALEKGSEQFLLNTFSESERAYCQSSADAATHFAGTFAAKEAFKKATGEFTVPLNQIEVRRTSAGKPEMHVRNEIDPSLLVSISHDTSMACAVAVKQSV